MLESSRCFSSPVLPIFSWDLKKIAYRGSFTIPSSSKLELLCQCEMTSWYYIVTKSSIDLPLVCFFFLRERLKINQADICIFKVKTKNTTTRCEICPNLKADLKISLYVGVHIKTIPWKFRILNPKDSRVIYP